MDSEELTSVYSLDDPNKAEIIKHALLAEGIKCELGGEHQAGFTGMGSMTIEVLVRAIDADRATKIIESHE